MMQDEPKTPDLWDEEEEFDDDEEGFAPFEALDRARNLRWGGEPAEAVEVLVAALEAFEQSDDADETEIELQLLDALAEAATEAGQHERAAEALARALRVWEIEEERPLGRAVAEAEAAIRKAWREQPVPPPDTERERDWQRLLAELATEASQVEPPPRNEHTFARWSFARALSGVERLVDLGWEHMESGRLNEARGFYDRAETFLSWLFDAVIEALETAARPAEQSPAAPWPRLDGAWAEKLTSLVRLASWASRSRATLARRSGALGDAEADLGSAAVQVGRLQGGVARAFVPSRDAWDAEVRETQRELRMARVDVLQEMGRAAEAAAAAREVWEAERRNLERLRRRIEADPDASATGYAADLVEAAQAAVSALVAAGDPAEALRLGVETVNLWRDVPPGASYWTAGMEAAGHLCRRVAAVARDLGDRAAFLDCSGQGTAIFTALAADGQPGAQFSAAQVLVLYGEACERLGDFKEAMGAYEEASLRLAPEADPETEDHEEACLLRAAALVHMGALLLEHGEAQPALDACDAAAELLRPLLARNPDDARARAWLARAERIRADAPRPPG